MKTDSKLFQWREMFCQEHQIVYLKTFERNVSLKLTRSYLTQHLNKFKNVRPRGPVMVRLPSQKRNRLDASCGFYRPDASCQQIVPSLLTSSGCIKPACSSQLAASLLTTCNRLFIIKPEQAMRTHPDIGLVIGDLLQLARFWLCTLRFIGVDE